MNQQQYITTISISHLLFSSLEELLAWNWHGLLFRLFFSPYAREGLGLLRGNSGRTRNKHCILICIRELEHLNSSPPLYVAGICSRTLSGCLKLRIVLDPIYAMFFSQYTHTFSFKGSTLWLLFGISNYQHCYSCISGPLLSKVKVT